MKIGYARVSTIDQNLEMQIDALTKAGCEKIYREMQSGAKKERPVLTEMLNNVRANDTIMIWKLDRLGRSLNHLVEIVEKLIERKVGLISLNDPIDTTTSQGRFVFNLFASLAEFEREVIRERTKAGLQAARARGRVGGRPKGISKEAEAISYAAAALYKEGQLSVRQIAAKLNISLRSLYKYLRLREVK
jgi:DNA invertase Pin-like site-specific DNA recombinase